ncbi:precorrin-3B synthase/cobaltochelatase CobN [Agrobacterium fabrum]|uniref:Precorrin-3B synthase/cobaltochelatase CobN n=1 Tax=Agrobacterium fabrum TaxID=1176649 RepID=A0A7Z7BMZ2_9HYPH|nr:precorrin-3B synthase/cobaltochelatase CobN [Agrobacterium fabrum]
MAAKIPPSVLPDISPSRGEIDKRRAFRFISTVGDLNCETKSVPQLISPLEGEMSGRTEGGKRHAPRGQIRRQTHAR